MALQSLQTRIEDAYGETVSGADVIADATYLVDLLNEGWYDIVGRLPLGLLAPMGTAATLDDSPTSHTMISGKILSVTRNDGVLDRECREVADHLRGRLADPYSVHYSDKTWPAFYKQANTLYVYPTTDASETATVVEAALAAEIAVADTSVAGFNPALVNMLVLYVIIGLKLREMGIGRRKAWVELEAITSSGILASLTTAYTDIETALGAVTTQAGEAKIGTALDAANTELDKVAAIIVEGSAEIDAGSTEIDAVFAGGTDGMFDDFDTAIGDVQSDIEKAQNVLGSGPSDETNAVDDLLVAAAATSPADEDAIQQLADDDLEKAALAIQLGQTRMQGAATFLQTAAVKTAEAQAELQNIAGHVQSLSQYWLNADSYFKEGAAYTQLAAGYLNEATQRFGRVAAYVQEAQARIGKAQTYLAECGVRLQTAQNYLSQSAQIIQERPLLIKEYKDGIDDYIKGAR